MGKKLKLGVVGCGGIANHKHFPAIGKYSDLCEITAFCDILEERAVKACSEHGTKDAKAFTDYKELVALPDIDVVYVLTPNVSHCPIAVAAFEAGKHVMCEKPMAATAKDAEAMIAAWKKSGKKFTVAYQNRFRGEVQALKKACAAGELGDIYYAIAHAIRRRGVPTWGVFPNKALQGGGPLIDIGTHALDMTLWMMDNYEPASVSGSVFYKLGHLPQAMDGNAFGPWDPDTYEVEDSAFGMVKMKNGALIKVEASWAINLRESKESSTTLCGTLAGAEIIAGMGQPCDMLIMNRGHNGVLTEEKLSAGGGVAYFEGNSGDAGTIEAKQWLDAIINDTNPLVMPEQAYAVTRILDAIYRSAQSGKEVYFD